MTDDIQKEIVRKLMDETGHGMTDCKKALQTCNWDAGNAKVLLNEMEKLSGLTRLATKR